jgi:hypothetical protein
MKNRLTLALTLLIAGGYTHAETDWDAAGDLATAGALGYMAASGGNKPTVTVVPGTAPAINMHPPGTAPGYPLGNTQMGHPPRTLPTHPVRGVPAQGVIKPPRPPVGAAKGNPVKGVLDAASAFFGKKARKVKSLWHRIKK